MPAHRLTPVQPFADWWAKREDLSNRVSDRHAAGAKMRQYVAMALADKARTPMVVGCSAFSAMQIYVADAARRMNAPAHIFVPARKERSRATAWAAQCGAVIHEVRPGYASVCRSRAREFAKSLGGCIRWNPGTAIADTINQLRNLPTGCKRIVVPTGSGLTAAAIMAGLAETQRQEVTVFCVTVSKLATAHDIRAMASEHSAATLPKLVVKNCGLPYEREVMAHLPNGDRLDSFYAAKALPFVQEGDVLWVSGIRPVDCMAPEL